MNELYLFVFNSLISLVGMFICFKSLFGDSTSNNTKCVLTCCLGGLFWFAFMYTPYLHLHEPTTLDLILKIAILVLSSVWIETKIKENEGGV